MQTDDATKELLLAVLEGQEAKVAEMLNGGLSVNITGNQDNSSLHIASMSGNVGVGKLLLARGADINQKNSAENTPLHLAATHGDADFVQLLLDAGADPNALNTEKCTPLFLASAQGHEPVVYLLLDHGADPSFINSAGYTALLMVVSESKRSIIQLLLAKGKNVKEWIDTKDSLDSTALLLAIRQAFFMGGTHWVVNTLLEAGADPHKSPDCLYLVVMNGLIDSLPIIIDKANDPEFVNSRNDDGATPLLVAAALGKTAAVQILIQKGADVKIATNDAARGHMEVCTALMQAGAKANSEDNNGVTPSHVAAEEGREEVLALMLRSGGSPDAANVNLNTPLHLAAENCRLGCVRALIAAGATIDAVNSHGWTALHWAAKKGDKTVIQELLKAGASKTLKDVDGNLPFQLAPNQDIAALLQANETSGPCAVCSKVKADDGTPCMRCSRCKNVFYCSQTCQASDWKNHKASCK